MPIEGFDFDATAEGHELLEVEAGQILARAGREEARHGPLEGDLELAFGGQEARVLEEGAGDGGAGVVLVAQGAELGQARVHDDLEGLVRDAVGARVGLDDGELGPEGTGGTGPSRISPAAASTGPEGGASAGGATLFPR